MVCGLALGLSGLRSIATSSSELKTIFKAPPRQFSTGPLWVWNDLLTADQIRSTLQDMAAQRIHQVWVHPRPGLMTPYLGEDWFKLWQVALTEAEKLDMNVWIYDENSYPSGFAGGMVPEAMPESRGKGLSLRETEGTPTWDEKAIGVYRLGENSFEDFTAKAKRGASLPNGRYMVASEVRAGNSPWHGNRSYVNLLSPGVTEKFLELTMEPYRVHVGTQFGKRIPGVFTDEPNIRPAGGLPWSEVLADEFHKRWGYDLLQHLPSLAKPLGDWRKVRHNYYQVLHEQFVEHWAKPYYTYCETNDLKFTGHYWDHEWPNCVGVPDNMAMYAWHQLPAIDCLMNQYREDTHAQFGNVRMVRELSSVANQIGRKQTLCETYGAGGWDLRFEDMKRIGDWLAVLGVNVLNQHLSYVTIRGARKRDHPQSFSYHAPWWEDYHVSAGYFARLSAALAHGEQVNRVLVLEPTTTAWMYQGDSTRLQELGDNFFKLLMALEGAQIEYDLGCEDIIAHHGRAADGELIIGKRAYSSVVIPPNTENLNLSTASLLTNVARLYCGRVPERVDGALPDGKSELSLTTEARTNLDLSVRSIVNDLKEAQTGQPVYLERALGDKGILFHQRRILEDGELLFLVNTSLEEPSSGVAFSRYGGVEVWDLYTGDTKPFHFANLGNRVSAKFDLPPSGSLLLFFTKKAIKPDLPATIARTYEPSTGVRVRRVEPNVLTLDYVNVTAAGETRTNVYFYAANQFAWEKNGMKRNPWDSAVQYKRELIDTRFPENSGFEASYSFVIEDDVPADLAIVIERPDLYSIECNGIAVQARKGDWWLDKAFGRIPIAKMATPGPNRVTLKAAPFTIFHELESAYLLGDFSLKQSRSGFVLVRSQALTLTEGTALQTHSTNPDRTAWLSRGIWSPPRSSDTAPFLVFDLGKITPLEALKIWNYNENHVRDLTGRGVRKLRILVGPTAQDCSEMIGEIEIAQGTGIASGPQSFKIKSIPTRFVKFEILSNYNGSSYPTAARSVADDGYVGLAEVQFLARANDKPLKGVRICEASSELSSHQREAKYLVDGSGLSNRKPGWNTQGHPFYYAGVAYAEAFDLGTKEGAYRVSMPDWYGSVARVKVNGKLAGHIDAPPWECDVTSCIKPGQNEVEVTVIGTPKNLLGPHHGSPALGAAWPGNFQHAPNPGPPPGASYSTVAYGLFKPFVIKQLKTERTAANESKGFGQR